MKVKNILLVLFVLVFASLTAFAKLADSKEQTLSGNQFIFATKLENDKAAEESAMKDSPAMFDHACSAADPYYCFNRTELGLNNTTGGQEYNYFGKTYADKKDAGHAFCSGCHELADVAFTQKPSHGQAMCKGCHANKLLSGHAMPASNGFISFNHKGSHNDATFARIKDKLGLNKDIPSCAFCHVGAKKIIIRYGSEPSNIGAGNNIQMLLINTKEGQARLKAVKCVKTEKDAETGRDAYTLVTDAKQCK